MKYLPFTVAASAVLFGALTNSAYAGGLIEPIVQAPTPQSSDRCVQSQSVDLRFGLLQSGNVWDNEIDALDLNGNDTGLPIRRDLGKGTFADFNYEWDRCDSHLSAEASVTSAEVAEVGSGSNRIEDEATLAFIDVEYGRQLTQSVDYFGGLRVLNYLSESRLAIDAVNSEAEASYTGVGPVIGISYETQNRTPGQFGLSGSLSAAALLGTQRNDVTSNIFVPADFTDESSRTVVSLDAEVGVFYNVTENTAVSMGVLYQHVSDIDFVSGNLTEPEGVSFERGDRDFLNAFVGYSLRF